MNHPPVTKGCVCGVGQYDWTPPKRHPSWCPASTFCDFGPWHPEHPEYPEKPPRSAKVNE